MVMVLTEDIEVMLAGSDVGTHGVATKITTAHGSDLENDLLTMDRVFKATKPTTYSTSRGQWGVSEQSVDDVARAVDNTLFNIAEQAKLLPDVKRVYSSWSSYACSVLPVNADGSAARERILIWEDTRAFDKYVKAIDLAGIANGVNEAHPAPSAQWMMAKMLYLITEEWDNVKDAARIVEFHDYLMQFLTGERTISNNHIVCKWNYVDGNSPREVLKKALTSVYERDFNKDGVAIKTKMAKLNAFVDDWESSRVVMMGEEVGTLRPELAEKLGLKKVEVHIGEAGIDLYAALVGTCCTLSPDYDLVATSRGKKGVKIDWELGSSACTAAGRPDMPNGKGGWGVFKGPIMPGIGIVEAGIATAGSVVDEYVGRLANELGLGDLLRATALGFGDLLDKFVYRQLDILAEQSPVGSNGIMVVPYFQGGRRSPFEDSSKKSIVYGESLASTAGDKMRSIYEAIAFVIRNIHDNLREQYGFDGDYEIVQVVASGGIGNSALFRQILADVCDVEVVQTEHGNEAAAFGNIIMAKNMADGKANADLPETAKEMVRYRLIDSAEAGAIGVPDKANHEQYAALYTRWKKLEKLS